MIKSNLTSSIDKKELCTLEGYCVGRTLITQTYGSINGNFKTAALAGAASSNIVVPDGDEAIVLTDLIITSDKTNNATVVLKFTDGTNDEIIFNGDASNNTINIAIAFQGHWQGWQSAYLQFITDTGGQVANCAVGYFYLPKDKAYDYSEWNGRR